jgi:phosphoglycerol transferase MdoB-like AlkP superfamily enzyme
LAIFSVIYATVPGLLGQGNKSLKWDTWRNPRNVYDSFSDQNKNMKICGLFEYTVRDFYITFLMADSEQNPDEMELLENTYSEQTAHKKNKYTGFFKGKNVIFIQLEGMDSWLITPEDTPNIYGMLNNSLVFNNHYSYYTGGGSTFNSELAVSTGYITPVSYTKNPYSFTGNTFLYSLPRQLKNAGYTANAFHMNTGEYYTRDINYKNWGYDDYYSLLDDGNYEDASYQLDRELILNEFFYEKMFKQDSKFMHYIITYTPHTPFSINSETAKLILAELEGQEGETPVVAESQPQAEEPAPEGETVEEGEEAEPQVSEEEVARLFASETDKMMGLLLQALKDNGLLRNTIIVAYADHYLYTLNDKTILDQYKTTENNLINETPFFIWSNGMRRREFNKVNSQIDILPTVLNLLGIKYNDEWYIGRDIMDPDYQGYVFFSDRSWYDGVNYVENGVATNNPEADPQYIMDTNTHMNNLIQKNDLTLKYDFFKKKRE